MHVRWALGSQYRPAKPDPKLNIALNKTVTVELTPKTILVSENDTVDAETMRLLRDCYDGQPRPYKPGVFKPARIHNLEAKEQTASGFKSGYVLRGVFCRYSTTYLNN